MGYTFPVPNEKTCSDVSNPPISTDYLPRRGLRNGHLMTVFAWARPRQFLHLTPPEVRYFDVAPESRVMAHCHWQPAPETHPCILALHGLEGSSSAHYMRGLADKGYRAGFNVVLLNQRNCGGTEQLSSGLYHSGLSADADVVLRELASVDRMRQVFVAGYSLGGNLALKLAGDYGNEPPPQLAGVAAVSPVMDLAACVAALERRRNIVYHLNFVRGLRGRMRRKAQWYPGRFDVDRLARVWSVRAFDEVYTAPHFGYASAADYYYRASALRVVDRICVPALIITAEDDPFVPSGPFRDPALTANPNVQVVVTRHGGHCGFVAEPANGDDGYWAETQVIERAGRLCGR